MRKTVLRKNCARRGWARAQFLRTLRQRPRPTISIVSVALLAVYYKIHIAYHPLWAREWNDAEAFGPFL